MLLQRKFRRWLVGAWVLLTFGQSLAQVQLTYPMERMVFQRDSVNQAMVQIAGSFSNSLDRLEVRLTNRITKTTGSWTNLQQPGTTGQFSGTLAVSGGWYKLEVRGLSGSEVVGQDSVVRVGVGEVFAIFGHSNAQGSSCGDGTSTYTGPNLCPTLDGATDDRVCCVRLNENNTATFSSPAFSQYLTTANTYYLPGLAGFSHLDTYVGLSPFAQFAWYWGKLGDMLVEQLEVPVLFYNAGFGGSNMEQTYKAAYNIPFSHWFVNYDLRMPYANLRNLMNLYVPSTGLRAVLLQHGENDRGNPTEDIKTHNYGVINKVRDEFSMPNLAWLIATSSYAGGQFENVRSAQWAVSHDVSYPYNLPGPDLDQVTARPDGIHFSPAGQEQVAQAWFNTITATNFLTVTRPYKPQLQPLASVSCGAANNLTLTLPGGYARYDWGTGQTTQAISVSAGVYNGRIRATNQVIPGNGSVPDRVLFPPAVVVPSVIRPLVPTISPTNFSLCADQLVVLSATSVDGSPILWNTSVKSSTLAVEQAGIYSAQALHPVYGCASGVATASVLSISTTGLPISSRHDGYWHDPSTWSCYCIPSGCNVVTVQHRVSDSHFG